MKTVEKSSTIKDVLSIASCLVTLAFPIVGAFKNGNMAHMWFCAWLTQFFVLIAIIFAYRTREKESNEKNLVSEKLTREEEEAQDCFKLIPESALNLLKEINATNSVLSKDYYGTVFFSGHSVNMKDFRDLETFDLIIKSPTNRFNRTSSYSITKKGYRVLALAEKQRKQ